MSEQRDDDGISSPDLKECPFCGGPAVNVAGEYIMCGSPVFIDCAGRSVRCDNAAWNTRAASPPTPAETVGKVERVAIALAWHNNKEKRIAWERCSETTQAYYKAEARVAIKALGSGPASSAEQQDLATVLFQRLSVPQRLMLAEDVRSIGNPERFVLCGDRVFSAANGPTRNVLKKKGLVELSRFGPMTLTPLGLAVRTLATTPARNTSQIGEG